MKHVTLSSLAALVLVAVVSIVGRLSDAGTQVTAFAAFVTLCVFIVGAGRVRQTLGPVAATFALTAAMTGTIVAGTVTASADGAAAGVIIAGSFFAVVVAAIVVVAAVLTARDLRIPQYPLMTHGVLTAASALALLLPLEWMWLALVGGDALIAYIGRLKPTSTSAQQE